jgi:hypothetical protein
VAPFTVWVPQNLSTGRVAQSFRLQPVPDLSATLTLGLFQGCPSPVNDQRACQEKCEELCRLYVGALARHRYTSALPPGLEIGKKNPFPNVSLS